MNRKNLLLGLVIAAVLIAGYSLINKMLFDGVRPQTVEENGLVAQYYATNEEPQPAVLLVGGGMWGAYWASECARAGYPALSLTYYGVEGLPPLPEAIDLGYFEKGLAWLAGQEAVDAEHIVVMGASKNAELALVIASYYPELVSGCVAFAPSSVSWSNTVLPYNSDQLKPSLTFEGSPVPYLPMDKLQPGNSDTLETLSYWQNALNDSAAVAHAAIPVERIQGPILLFSGEDDQVWPSVQMGEMIKNRLNARPFSYSFEHLTYQNSGHYISGNPAHQAPSTYGQMSVNGKPYYLNFGGTPQGDQDAQWDAKQRVLDYFQSL